MPFSTIVEVSLETVYANQQCINRWTYLGYIDGDENTRLFSDALLAALGYDGVGAPEALSMFAVIFANLAQSVNGTGLIAFDPWEPTDYLAAPLEEWGGGQIGDSLSPAMALGFRSSRSRRDIRRSTKRFAGVTEAFVGAAGALSSAGAAASSAIAAKMSVPVTKTFQGVSYLFTPITVSKEKYPVPNTTPVRHAYRYYTTRESQLQHYSVVTDWSGYGVARTQVSRQYGSGR